MKHRLHPRRCNLEHSAIEVRPATGGSAIEVPVAAQNQPTKRANAVTTGEGVEHRLVAGRGDLEHGAVAGGAAVRRGAIEISVAALNQCGLRVTSVSGS